MPAGIATSVTTGITTPATPAGAVAPVASLRLTGASEFLRESVPRAAAPAFEAATHLGDPTLLTFALALLYWVGRRRETAAVVGYAFAAYGVVVALKYGLAMPRPPEAVRLIAVDGYGFPSGHAVAAAVVYGGLAVEFDWLEDAPRLAATVAVVAAVALSRVVLGVHYLGDVLAGVAVGVALLVGFRVLTEGEPVRGFALGIPAALAAIAVTGASATALGILGGCVGGVLASARFEAVPDSRSYAEAALLVAVGLPFVAVVRAAADYLTDPVVLAAVDDALLVAGVLLLPAALDRVEVVDRLPSGAGDR